MKALHRFFSCGDQFSLDPWTFEPFLTRQEVFKISCLTLHQLIFNSLFIFYFLNTYFRKFRLKIGSLIIYSAVRVHRSVEPSIHFCVRHWYPHAFVEAVDVIHSANSATLHHPSTSKSSFRRERKECT